MNIYFVDIKLKNEKYRFDSGVHKDINLVIAESEDDAIEIMKNLTSPYWESISIPEGASGPAVTGNGKDAKEYLVTPSNITYSTLTEYLDSLLDHYNRYEYKIWDKQGEVKLLNDYQHSTTSE